MKLEFWDGGISMPSVEVHRTCPNCRRQVVQDFGGYLPYATANKPIQMKWCCNMGGCMHTWEERVELVLGVKPAGDVPSKLPAGVFWSEGSHG